MRAFFLLVLLVGCSAAPPVSDSRPLGTVSVAWDVGAKASFADSSATVALIPLTYTDLDDLQSGNRYLTVTFRVENQSTGPLENLTLRAYAATANLGGTAVGAVRAFPSPSHPDGTAITDPLVAQSIRPIQGTQLGPAGPEPDPQASNFEGFSQAESAGLERGAQAQGLLAGSEQVLDYGFAASDRTINPGATSLINVAVKLPRTFSTSPTPYRFKLSFLLTTSPTLRVSQALGETTSQALARAEALLSGHQMLQLVLLSSDPVPPQSGLSVVRLTNLRIGIAPTYLLQP